MINLVYGIKPQFAEGYFVDEYGCICQSGTNKKVANFNISILGWRRVHEEPVKVTMHVIFSVAFWHDGKLQHSNDTIETTSFYCLPHYLACNYPGCFIYKESAFKDYISLLYRAAGSLLPVEDSYFYSGWDYIDGRMQYLSASRVGCKTDIYVPCGLWERCDIWNYGLDLLKLGNDGQFNPMMPLLVYLLAAYAAKPLEDAGIPLRCALCVIGESGSLKTAVCSLLAEPFGTHESLTLRDSMAAIMRSLGKAKDRVIFLDDIYRQAPELLEKAEAVVRAYGDGQVRAVADVTNQQNILRAEVRGGCIITGEKRLNLQRSSALRLLEIDIQSDSFSQVVLTSLQQEVSAARMSGQPSRVAQFFGAWIDFVEQHYEYVIQVANDFPFAMEKYITDRRLLMVFHQLAIIAKVFFDWGLSIGAISQKEAEFFLQAFFDAIHRVVSYNQLLALIAEPWILFMKIFTLACHDKSLPIANTRKEYLSTSNNYAGFFEKEKDRLVMNPKKTVAIFYKYLSDNNILIGNVRPGEIWQMLCEHGICLGYSSQQNGDGKERERYLQKIFLKGKQEEMAVFRVSEMEKYL